LDQSTAKRSEFSHEVELLSTLNIDGVITTNWDTFLEQIFPDYKKYTGQDQLIFSNPQEVGKIYKMHGCCTDPKSLVLTAEDYDQFNKKNAYLAAKLTTIFIEHPIVFIGYSMNDPNIKNLLGAISGCIGKNKVEELRKNLIFIERLLSNEEVGISEKSLVVDGVEVPLISIKTNEFSEVYKAISIKNREIPAQILRYCKEQLYELVKSFNPEKKMSVVSMDEISTKDDIEFVVGVGVAEEQRRIA
jgi:hypothetical protein